MFQRNKITSEVSSQLLILMKTMRLLYGGSGMFTFNTDLIDEL